MLSLKPRAFVQSSIDMQAPRLESTSYALPFRMVFFYLVTTGSIFDISLCENSINQSINQWSAGPFNMTIVDVGKRGEYYFIFKKNQNSPTPSEHPKNVKTFRWDQKLQIKN